MQVVVEAEVDRVGFENTDDDHRQDRHVGIAPTIPARTTFGAVIIFRECSTHGS